MRVLFVSSGNRQNGISPIVLNQGKSLEKKGLSVEYYILIGKGIKGYLKNIFKLSKYLSRQEFDIIHAHYSLSGFVAALAGAKPLIVSLMGSDVKAKSYYRILIQFFEKCFWKATIVKSEDMKVSLGIAKVKVVPNGVNFERFLPIDKKNAQSNLKWDSAKRHLLFASDPKRPEKNYELAKNAVVGLARKDIELHCLVNIPNKDVPLYYSASDLVILSSLWEGSPNAIKEAMACNVPIVSTDVGDVRVNIGKTIGCYVSSFDEKEFTECLRKSLEHGDRTNGRENIFHLSSENIAQKIIDIYESVVNRNS